MLHIQCVCRYQSSIGHLKISNYHNVVEHNLIQNAIELWTLLLHLHVHVFVLRYLNQAEVTKLFESQKGGQDE